MTTYRKDNDGHRYEIPDELAAKFDCLFTACYSAKYGTDAYWDAEVEFNNEFEQFMVG